MSKGKSRETRTQADSALRTCAKRDTPAGSTVYVKRDKDPGRRLNTENLHEERHSGRGSTEEYAKTVKGPRQKTRH